MPSIAHSADEIAQWAAESAARTGRLDFGAFNDLPVAIYATDADGILTYFNRASVDFAGRTPSLNEDRWCVTWRLSRPDGTRLPHDECPMAAALRDKRSVRGILAVAERPDGSQSAFLAFPTPLFRENGDLLGAINVLVETATGEPARFLAEEARRCRRLAAFVDERTAIKLDLLASEYEEQMRQLTLWDRDH